MILVKSQLRFSTACIRMAGHLAAGHLSVMTHATRVAMGLPMLPVRTVHAMASRPHSAISGTQIAKVATGAALSIVPASAAENPAKPPKPPRGGKRLPSKPPAMPAPAVKPQDATA